MAEEINDESLENLTGTEKSAILMMLLGEDEAAQVLQKLTPREVQHLGTAMYSVTGVDQTTVNAVLDEFLETIKKQTGIGLGAGQYGAYMKSLSSPILFTHNTFLGLLVEFGALGVLLALGLLYLIAMSIRHWPFHIMLIVLAFFIFPMLFHDVLGLRINHVVIALGLTAAARWRRRQWHTAGHVRPRGLRQFYRIDR